MLGSVPRQPGRRHGRPHAQMGAMHLLQPVGLSPTYGTGTERHRRAPGKSTASACSVVRATSETIRRIPNTCRNYYLFLPRRHRSSLPSRTLSTRAASLSMRIRIGIVPRDSTERANRRSNLVQRAHVYGSHQCLWRHTSESVRRGHVAGLWNTNQNNKTYV